MHKLKIVLLLFLNYALLSSALIFYLQFRQTQKRFHLLSAIVSIALILAIALIGIKNGAPFIRLFPPRLSVNDMPMLKELGEDLIRDINDFHVSKGRYPLDLEEACLTPKPTKYGPWKYRYFESTGDFEIGVGDYGKNKFTLSWHSKYNRWHTDT